MILYQTQAIQMFLLHLTNFDPKSTLEGTKTLHQTDDELKTHKTDVTPSLQGKVVVPHQDLAGNSLTR